MREHLKVLIVEDDEDDLFLTERALTKAGLKNIYHVIDGRQAIDYLMGSNSFSDRAAYPFPDVILIDLKIPEINGHQVAEWIRSQPDLYKLRRYILSSSGEERDRKRATNAQVSGYLVKPLTASAVQTIVN